MKDRLLSTELAHIPEWAKVINSGYLNQLLCKRQMFSYFRGDHHPKLQKQCSAVAGKAIHIFTYISSLFGTFFQKYHAVHLIDEFLPICNWKIFDYCMVHHRDSLRCKSPASPFNVRLTEGYPSVLLISLICSSCTSTPQNHAVSGKLQGAWAA